MQTNSRKSEYLPPRVTVTELEDILTASFGVSDTGVGDSYSLEIFRK